MDKRTEQSNDANKARAAPLAETEHGGGRSMAPLTYLPIVVALAAPVLAYALWYRGRPDYLGHYLAGFGGACLMLTVLLAIQNRPRWSVVVVVVVAILVGSFLEATVNRIAFFDPIDFANQNLGACVAGSLVIDRHRSIGFAFAIATAGLLTMAAGAKFALG